MIGRRLGDGTGRIRPGIRIGVGFVVALAVLGVFVHGVGGRRVLSSLLAADGRFVAAGVIGAVAGVLCWSEAQRRVLVATTGRRIGGRFRIAYFAGDFTKQVLPLGHVSGPALMALTVSVAVDVSYERALAGITVSDLLNLVSSLCLAGLGLLFVLRGTGGRGLGQFARLFVVALVGVALLVALVVLLRAALLPVVVRLAEVLHGTVGRLSARAARALDPVTVRTTVSTYVEGLDAATADRRQLVVGAAFSVVGWLLLAGALSAAGAAVDVPVRPAAALFLVPISGLATWLPIPGGVGGVELVLVAGLLATTGANAGLVTATVLLFRLCSYWVVVLVDGGAMLYFAATE